MLHLKYCSLVESWLLMVIHYSMLRLNVCDRHGFLKLISLLLIVFVLSIKERSGTRGMGVEKERKSSKSPFHSSWLELITFTSSAQWETVCRRREAFFSLCTWKCFWRVSSLCCHSLWCYESQVMMNNNIFLMYSKTFTNFHIFYQEEFFSKSRFYRFGLVSFAH